MLEHARVHLLEEARHARDDRGPDLDRIGGIQKITAQHSDAGRARFTIEAEKDKNVRPEIARAIIGSGWELNELHGVSLSLENIFLELTSKQEAA